MFDPLGRNWRPAARLPGHHSPTSPKGSILTQSIVGPFEPRVCLLRDLGQAGSPDPFLSGHEGGPATFRCGLQSLGDAVGHMACLAIRFFVGCALIIHLIIQTILLDPSKAVWSDGASNVSRLDPSGAV